MSDYFDRITNPLKRMLGSFRSDKKSAYRSNANDTHSFYRFPDSQLSTEIDLSYMRPLKREKVIEKFDTFRYRDDLSAASYEDALILPGKGRKGGVFDSNGNFVEDSKSKWFGGTYNLEDNQSIDYDERTVVFLGEYAASVWGHAFISLLVRFWYCHSQEESADAYVIVSEAPGQKKNNKPLNDLIRFAGIEDKVIYVDQPTRFKKVIVPELSFTSESYGDGFWETMDTIKENALNEPYDNEETPEKVFLSRSNFPKAKDAEGGVELLDDYFERNGFTILHPQEIPLARMIRIMQNAKVCASESGSITFNTLFGNRDLDVIVIERVPIFANGNMATNLSRANRITYIDSNYLIWPSDVGGACMIGFTEELEKYTCDNGYLRPSTQYLDLAAKESSFEIYKKRYESRNMYQQWSNSNKPDWINVVYESFLASIDQFPWLDKEAIIEKYYKDVNHE